MTYERTQKGSSVGRICVNHSRSPCFDAETAAWGKQIKNKNSMQQRKINTNFFHDTVYVRQEEYMSTLEHLYPERVFYYFKQIAAIPHGSGNTKAISDYLVKFAKRTRTDLVSG